jgi:ketosteroid isomerase-like protein
MSQELVDRYLGAIDAWNRGDLETWLALAADEWHTTATFPGVEPVYHGRAGMTAIWEYLHAPWDSAADIQIDVDRVEDLGDTVLGLTTLRARAHAAGPETAIEVGYVLTDDHGVLKLRNYMSWDEALRAVGLAQE